MGRHYQVAVGREVSDVGRFAGDGRDLAFYTRDLEHATWVMLQQVALERLPASANSHHHMFIMQHLERQRKRQIDIYCTWILILIDFLSISGRIAILWRWDACRQATGIWTLWPPWKLTFVSAAGCKTVWMNGTACFAFGLLHNCVSQIGGQSQT